MIYLQLFISFIKVGLFSFGGGYAAIPLIQSQVVELHPWLDMSEFTDLITIAEMTPGPIAVNSATFVGIRIAGLPGAIAATFGCILPSCLIVSALFYAYYRYQKASVMQSILSGLRPAVIALIASAGLSVLGQVALQGNEFSASGLNYGGLLLFLAAFFVLRKYKLNPIAVMSACGLIGLFAGVIFGA